jgi:hypothetical protein
VPNVMTSSGAPPVPFSALLVAFAGLQLDLK